MKGLIFTSFLHLVEQEYGLEMVDEIITKWHRQAAVFTPQSGITTTLN